MTIKRTQKVYRGIPMILDEKSNINLGRKTNRQKDKNKKKIYRTQKASKWILVMNQYELK